MCIIGIIVGIFFYLFLGIMASEGLIGNRTFYYECHDSEFGPFNVFKGKSIEHYSKDLEKENSKRIFYCIVCGIFAYIFLVFYTIYASLKRYINIVKWAFL